MSSFQFPMKQQVAQLPGSAEPATAQLAFMN